MIKCVLDEDGCIDLLAVMRIMNQVDQEQVWAIAYELAALMQRLWPAGNCALIESLAQIYIHRDGHIHEKTLLATLAPNVEANLQDTSKQLHHHHHHHTTTTQIEPLLNSTTTTTTTANATDHPTEDSSTQHTTNKSLQHQQQLPPSPPITPELSELIRRRPALNESELVSSLGIALFWALDYGIPDDEERKLSMSMEYLIFKSQSELSLNEVLEICIKRLPIATKTNADLHYRDVCKSLIGDTIELSIFLDKIYKATMELSGMNGSTRRRTTNTNTTATSGAGNNNNPVTETGLVDECCLVAAAAAAKRRHKSLSDGDSKDDCDSILGAHHHHHHHQIHYHQLAHVDHDALSQLGLPLASLRALKIDDWARLWMQVIKEMRQRSKFKHLGIATSTTTTTTTTTTTNTGHELGCSNL